MMTKIDERKNIIISLKSSYDERNKGIDKHIQTLKGLSIMSIILSVFCFGVIFTSIISEQFGFDSFVWQKTGLYALLSFISFINLPTKILEIKLLNHLKKINQFNDFNGIEKLNIDLKSLINNLNSPLKTNLISLIFGFIILVMSAWQIISNNNPYWEYMKIPIILFFSLTIIRFITINNKLTENIRKTENTVANN